MFLKYKYKGFQYGSLFFALAFLALPFFSFSQTEDETATPEEVTIIGVGDMMIGTNFPSRGYLPKDGGSSIFKETGDILRDADVTFGNLEGTMFDGEGEQKKCNDSTLCYLFRTPANYVRHYFDAGFDILSLANNHSGDFGATGRSGTKRVLKNAGILYAGLAGTDEKIVFEKNGIKYGFCAFAPNSGTCDIRQISKAKEMVASLEKECDIVIVSFHGGAEGADHQHVPKKTEYYLGEDRGNVYEFSHAVIDAGADIVFGHGPHVTRGVELYKGRFITYSMGNFATYSRISLAAAAGIAPIFKITTDKNGVFKKGEIVPTYQIKGQGPKIDKNKRVISKIKELTTADFKGGGLEISADGLMGIGN